MKEAERMKHSYIFDSLCWKAEGTYYDENGSSFPLRGEVEIIHTGEKWSLDGFMEVEYSIPVRFTNTYEISSSEKRHTLNWKSYNPALGVLRGSFEVIGDCIISHYKSEDGMYSGTETLFYKDEKHYYNAGVSFCNGKKMSSWTAVLNAV